MFWSIIVISAGPHWARLTAPAIAGLKKHARGEHELIVVDNAGAGQGDVNLDVMVPYAEACNRGAYNARGDRLLILNNDIVVSGDYLSVLGRQALEGPTVLRLLGDVDYVEGWAVSIDHHLWDILGGFDVNLKNSWEDVDLSWRAQYLGFPPHRLASFPISHMYNGTRQHTAGADQWYDVNMAYFVRKRARNPRKA